LTEPFPVLNTTTTYTVTNSSLWHYAELTCCTCAGLHNVPILSTALLYFTDPWRAVIVDYSSRFVNLVRTMKSRVVANHLSWYHWAVQYICHTRFCRLFCNSVKLDIWCDGLHSDNPAYRSDIQRLFPAVFKRDGLAVLNHVLYVIINTNTFDLEPDFDWIWSFCFEHLRNFQFCFETV